MASRESVIYLFFFDDFKLVIIPTELTDDIGWKSVSFL